MCIAIQNSVQTTWVFHVRGPIPLVRHERDVRFIVGVFRSNLHLIPGTFRSAGGTGQRSAGVPCFTSMDEALAAPPMLAGLRKVIHPICSGRGHTRTQRSPPTLR
eukprot:COSAG02_NODE_45071_length_360_cov_1.160920_1_plen_104_part_10